MSTCTEYNVWKDDFECYKVQRPCTNLAVVHAHASVQMQEPVTVRTETATNVALDNRQSLSVVVVVASWLRKKNHTSFTSI